VETLNTLLTITVHLDMKLSLILKLMQQLKKEYKDSELIFGQAPRNRRERREYERNRPKVERQILAMVKKMIA